MPSTWSGEMNKEEMQNMMQQMFANMTPDEKTKMMMGMMKENIKKGETAPKMGAKEGSGGKAGGGP